MQRSPFASLLTTLAACVQEAGAIIRDHNTKPRSISYKGRIDLVTATDLAVEDFLKQQLSQIVPHATFIGEESASSEDLTDCCWIVDPIDGTTNFAHGLPFVATSVALWANGNVELAVVNAPLLDECYTAKRGQGAFCNEEAISVSRINETEKALAATGFPYSIKDELPRILHRLHHILGHVQGLRRCGAAALDLAWLAQGRFDIFYEHGLKPWDLAAGHLLVEEAGGKTSLINGDPFDLRKGEILASNGSLHTDCLKLLRSTF